MTDTEIIDVYPSESNGYKKGSLVPYDFLIHRQKEEQEGWANRSAGGHPWDARLDFRRLVV